MQLNIDTTSISENGFTLVKEGWYTAQISDQEEKQTKKGGSQLVVDYLICDSSDFNGSTVKERYNIICPGSPKAESIGRNQIGLVGKHCGIDNLRDSEDLIGKTLDIYVEIQEAEGEYKARNIISKTRKHEESAPASASAPASSGASDVPPWMRNKT